MKVKFTLRLEIDGKEEVTRIVEFEDETKRTRPYYKATSIIRELELLKLDCELRELTKKDLCPLTGPTLASAAECNS